MKHSPLYETHKSCGARFAKVRGWEVPAHYGDPVSEHRNVREAAGIMDITHRGKIRISGKDRAMFLQNILSQDINRLTPYTGAYATLLNVKGKMLAYIRIYGDDNSFLIDTEPGLTERIIETLKHYLFREDVTIEDITGKYGLITIHGPLSREILRKVTQKDIAEMSDCAHLDLNINAVSCKVVSTSYTGGEGYDIYVPWDDLPGVWETFFSGRVEHKIRPFGLDTLETLRIEAGTPLYFIDMDENTIPIEANLDNAISYDKGCYIGQETIARLKFKGHVNRVLTGFYINGKILPERGDRIYKIVNDTEHNIGVITSRCFSPTLNRGIALGYIRIEHNEAGGEIHIERNGKRLTAMVTKPPFYCSS